MNLEPCRLFSRHGHFGIKKRLGWQTWYACVKFEACAMMHTQKKNPVLQADRLSSRVDGLSGHFFFFLSFLFFRLLVTKMIQKTNFKNLTFFAEKLWENILPYFSKKKKKILDFGKKKKGSFYKILAKPKKKKKKKFFQYGKFGSVTPVKQGFLLLLFFCCLIATQALF